MIEARDMAMSIGEKSASEDDELAGLSINIKARAQEHAPHAHEILHHELV